MVVGPSRCRRGVVTVCRQPFEQERHPVERGVGDFRWCFSKRPHWQKNHWTTTRQLAKLDVSPSTSHKPPCSTWPLQFDNFASRQGAPTPYLQQPATTSYETATHMFIRLILPKSVGLAFIVYFHFTTDITTRTDCYNILHRTVTKITFCSVRVSQILLNVLKAHVYSHWGPVCTQQTTMTDTILC